MLGIIQHARSTLKNCEHHDSNLNLTVRSDLAPSVGNDIISLKIGFPNNYFIDLAHVCQKAIYEDIILKFSSPSMAVKLFYIKQKK